MKPDDIKNEISQLDLSQKLALVEDVWDAIAADNAELPMYEWQRLELDRRYKAYEAGQVRLRDWESVHEELRDKYE